MQALAQRHFVSVALVLTGLCAPVAADPQEATGLQDAIAAALAEDGLEAIWQVGTPFPETDAGWQAPNRDAGLRSWFLPDGVHVTPHTDAGLDWTLDLGLQALSRGGTEVLAGGGVLEVDGARASYRRDGLVEWYVNREGGIEQGFDLTRRPLSGEDGDLSLILRLGGGLEALEVRQHALAFGTSGAGVVLRFTGLHAYDARGEGLPTRFVRTGERIAIEVDDSLAHYPITIDPILSMEEAFLYPTLPPPSMHFGSSLDLEGDRAIVGAPGNNASAGVAYVFQREAGEWRIVSKLVSDADAPGGRFGNDVTLHGDVAAVGMPLDREGGLVCGSVYTYEFDGVRWAFNERLVSSSPVAQGQFGAAVAVTDGVLVVGAPGESHSQLRSGLVHFYRDAGGTWVSPFRLVPISALQNGRFGASLDFADPTHLAIGEPGYAFQGGGGRVSFFEDPGTGWRWIESITTTYANDLGYSVAYSPGYLVAGSPATAHQGQNSGAAVFFERIGSVWTPVRDSSGQAEGERYGSSVAIGQGTDGAIRALVGAPRRGTQAFAAGAAVLYRHVDGLGFAMETTLLPPVPVVNGYFGGAVALDGDLALVGQQQAVSGAQRSGRVHAFDRSGTTWNEAAGMVQRDHDSGDHVGESVAIRGDVAVVGVSLDDDGLRGAGSVLVFERNGSTWTQTARLTAGHHAGRFARFGEAVALDDDQILVGATGEDYGLGPSGAAYIFRRNLGGGWGGPQRLVPPDGGANHLFGDALAIVDDLLVVGAEQGEGSASHTGTAYVFRRSSIGLWLLEQKLFDPNGAGSDSFGRAVGIASDAQEIVVGAPRADLLVDGQPSLNSGGAFVFRVQGGAWRITDVLAPQEQFAGLGWCLDIEGDRLAVGAPLQADAVYLYRRTGATWELETVLRGSGGDFGEEVGVAGDQVIVATLGRALLFQRLGTLWVPTELVPSTGALDHVFARPVDTDGERVIVGSPRENTVHGGQAGGAWIFRPEALEDFALTGAGDGSEGACPCDNESAPGSLEGCTNSTGRGAFLFAAGSASLAANDLRFVVRRMPPGKPCQLFAGTQRSAALPFSDGLRVAVGSVRRLDGFRFADVNGSASWDGLAANAGFQVGETLVFQVYYRDPMGPDGCSSGANLSSGVVVAFRP